MTDGSSNDPQLPRDYHLVRRDRVGDTLSLARELAAGGADEGTLVWALQQSAARTRNAEPWLSSAGDLHCALVLRPEFDRATSLQLVPVAACSLGAALAQAVSPMTVLHYRWPDDVLLRQAKVASIRVAGQPSNGGFAWLVLGVDVNVAQPPQALSMSAAAVQPDGECELTREQLLEDFARYFLRTINDWAEAGFSPILGSWRRRLADLQHYRRVRLVRGTVDGVLQDVNDAGAAVLEQGGRRRSVSLTEYFGFDE